MNRKVLYVQYTNPAVYPPLEHGSRLLAEAGWQALFLGVGALGAEPLTLPSRPGIRVRLLPFCPGGWKQKLHYLAYAAWVFWTALRWRPKWIHASDPMSCPIALPLTWVPGLKVLYQEHDPPGFPEGRAFKAWALLRWARRKLARRADLCVLPNPQRLERFSAETGRTENLFLVWNCPYRGEALAARAPEPSNGLTVFYHGSLVPSRLPVAFFQALKRLPDSVRFRAAGYSPIGHFDYVERLKQEAQRLGIAGRVSFEGAIPLREDLLARARSCDVGVALMPARTDRFNEQAMEGASNKPFDYLACGLALLVSDLPNWKKFYVEPGYGLACDPENPESIERALRWFLENPEEAKRMGEEGRRRVLRDWNYDTQFQPVLRRLSGEGAC